MYWLELTVIVTKGKYIQNLHDKTAHDIIHIYCEYYLAEQEIQINIPLEKIEGNNVQERIYNAEIKFIETSLIYVGMSLDVINDNANKLRFGIKQLILTINDWLQHKVITNKQHSEIKNFLFDKIFVHINRIGLDTYKVDNIQFSDMMFMIYEYTYKSEVHTSKYNFDGGDMRRTTFGRVEISTFNKYQDYKLNTEKFQFYLMDAIENSNMDINEIISIISNNKEIEYRTDFITKFYNNMEHFLSNIKNIYLPNVKVRKKQQLLSKILTELNINDSINLKDVTEYIVDRCSESNDELKELVIEKSSKVKTMTELFLKLINMRNSLHSNGKSNKNEIEFSIGQIRFEEVKQNEQNNSMGMKQICMLSLLMLYCMEQIIEKISIELKYTDIITDDYVQATKEFIKQNYNKPS